MGSLSIWHWIIVILVLAIYGVPITKILERAGWSKWWIILFFVPLVNIVMLWVFAYSRWPTLGRGSN
jgi:hypothetical protein